MKQQTWVGRLLLLDVSCEIQKSDLVISQMGVLSDM